MKVSVAGHEVINLFLRLPQAALCPGCYISHALCAQLRLVGPTHSLVPGKDDLAEGRVREKLLLAQLRHGAVEVAEPLLEALDLLSWRSAVVRRAAAARSRSSALAVRRALRTCVLGEGDSIVDEPLSQVRQVLQSVPSLPHSAPPPPLSGSAAIWRGASSTELVTHFCSAAHFSAEIHMGK